MYSNAFVWSRVLNYMEQHSPAAAVASFFDDAELIELSEKKMVVYSPSAFRKEVIENRYAPIILDAMRELYQTEPELVVLDEDEYATFSAGKQRTDYIKFN